MRPDSIALTGPAAAAHFGLDGFAGLDWTPRWCAPPNGARHREVIRTRRWLPPIECDGVLLAAPALVVRHLGIAPSIEWARRDRITRRDRIELAIEHALREGLFEPRDLDATGGHTGSPDVVAILNERGHEPPTESYAETRALQLLRRGGWTPWRQMRVHARGTVVRRVDFVIPYRPILRPQVLLPGTGLLVEIDGREFHERRFEEDHRRQTTYDRLGHRWTSFSATQIEREPRVVLAAIGEIFAKETSKQRARSLRSA